MPLSTSGTETPPPDEPRPDPTRVEITVAAHTVRVQSPDPLDTVAAKALELFRETTGTEGATDG